MASNDSQSWEVPGGSLPPRVLRAGVQAGVLPASLPPWLGVLVLTGVGETVPVAPSVPRAAGHRAGGFRLQLETLETPVTVEDLESKAGPSGRRDASLVVSLKPGW